MTLRLAPDVHVVPRWTGNNALVIRDAIDADLPRLLAITNEAVSNTTARWSDAPETLESRAAWLAACRADGYAVLVIDDGDTVAGFGALGSFRAYAGFRHTVEHSVYVDPRAARRGHGRALLAALEQRARAAGHHVMVGTIGADNEGSLALHRQAGFVEVGRMPEVGFKFGRWLDMVIVQKIL